MCGRAYKPRFLFAYPNAKVIKRKGEREAREEREERERERERERRGGKKDTRANADNRWQ